MVEELSGKANFVFSCVRKDLGFIWFGLIGLVLVIFELVIVIYWVFGWCQTLLQVSGLYRYCGYLFVLKNLFFGRINRYMINFKNNLLFDLIYVKIL